MVVPAKPHSPQLRSYEKTHHVDVPRSRGSVFGRGLRQRSEAEAGSRARWSGRIRGVGREARRTRWCCDGID